MNKNSTTSIDRWNSHTKEENKPWGIIIALLVAIALHLALFIFLREIQFFQKVNTTDIETDDMNVEQVILNEATEILPESAQTLPDLAETQEAIPELDDILPDLRNQDIDIKAEIKDPELSIKMSTPAKLGELDGVLDDVLLSTSSISALEEIGTGVMNNTIAADGQVILEEGSIEGELLDVNDIIDDSALKGAGGLALDGVMEGYSSLDALMSMSPVNLQGARTALPSDMLFEFGSADLKSAARMGLLKLCMLIERNPMMYCILEGHTDTYGEQGYNATLSKARASAVKNYILSNLDDVGERVIVRGYGKSYPLMAEGTQEEQAPNRRVDILMRKEVPPERTTLASSPSIETPSPESSPQISSPAQPPVIVEPVVAPRVEERAPTPPPAVEPINRAIIIEDEEEDSLPTAPPARKAIVVKPNRIPTVMSKPTVIRNTTPQRAIIVDEPDANIPRAIIVED